MNETCRDGKADGDCLLGFEPFPAIQADSAHRFKRARFLLHDGFPLFYSNEIHGLSLPWSNAGSIFADAHTRTQKSSLSIIYLKDLLSWSGRRCSGHESRRPDTVQLRKPFFQIRASAAADQPLVRAPAVRSALAIAVVQLVYNFHALRYHSER